MGILDKIKSQWASEDTWPPASVKDHWYEIEQYRRRYRNQRWELIQWDPNLSISAHKQEVFTPVGLPRELCRFSAALLFPDTPQITSTENEAVLERIQQVNDIGAFAVRGGVKAAAEGRVGIRILKDPAISSTPLMTIVPEDHIVWDIRHDHFIVGGMVVITRKEKDQAIRAANKIVWRLLEEHTPGLITRTLYKGEERKLGKAVPLSAYPEFADLVPEEYTGLDRATLVPWENVPGGESDLFGLGPLFNELNEAESLLLDRGRKSIPRTFVDRSLADEAGNVTELDGYILTGGSRVKMNYGDTSASSVHTAVPGFLSSEHIDWINHIEQLVVTCAGYAPSTWGIQGQTASVQRAVSGYAMKLAQLRTLLTRGQKAHMAMQAFGWSLATATAWDLGESKVADFLPTIELGDGLPSDPLDGAQEVLFLRQAQAASTETLVRTVNPTWTDAQVDEEVEDILESGAFPPGGGAAQGVGPLGAKMRSLLTDPAPKAGDGVDDNIPPVA